MYSRLCLVIIFLHGVVAQNSTISVTGENTIHVPQNIVQIQLGVKNQAKSAYDAQQMTSSASNRVLESLRGYNVTDLHTTYMSLQPVYNWTDSVNKLIGFESSTSLSYKTDPEIAGQTIDSAIRAGANTVDSVTPTISDEEYDRLYVEALSGAGKDAELKARTVAQSLNVCLQGPVTVNVEGGGNLPPSPTIMSYASVAAGAESASTVLPGKSDISASVYVEFAFSPC